MDTSSFNFYVLSGDALSYHSATYTPPGPGGAVLVSGTPETMTTAIVKEWFLQASTPLVGQAAADSLRALLQDDRVSELSADFLQKALDFRRTFIENTKQ